MHGSMEQEQHNKKTTKETSLTFHFLIEVIKENILIYKNESPNITEEKTINQ